MLKYDITFCASKTCTKIANCDRHYSNTNFPPNSIVSMADFSEGVEKFPLCVFDSNIDQMTKDVNISIQLSSRQMQFLDYNDIIDTVNIIRNGVLTPEQKGLALMERCPLCKQKKRRCK